MGQPSVKIVPDRVALQRYGLNTGDVEAVVAAAIGGQAVTQVYEGEKSFDLTVRWKPEYRTGLSAIRQITVASPDGSQIPLGELASITPEASPSVIYREDGLRYSPVKFSVRGRDLQSTITDAQRQIRQTVRLPPDSHLEWSGEINELKDAMGRLVVIIPLTLLLIGFLTYSAVGNIVDTLLVLINIPVACSGGILALLITGEPFSVSAAMGFISIFGIAIQDAMLVVTYAQRQWAEGYSLIERRPQCGRTAPPSGAHDHAHRDAGADAGGSLPRNRLPDAATAGDRRHRRRTDPGRHSARSSRRSSSSPGAGSSGVVSTRLEARPDRYPHPPGEGHGGVRRKNPRARVPVAPGLSKECPQGRSLKRLRHIDHHQADELLNGVFSPAWSESTANETDLSPRRWAGRPFPDEEDASVPGVRKNLPAGEGESSYPLLPLPRGPCATRPASPRAERTSPSGRA